MASYTINGPDGRKVRVKAPEGATAEQVQAKIQQVKANWSQFAPPEKTRNQEIMDNLEAPGVAQRMLRGVPGLGGALDEIGAGFDSALDYVSGGKIGTPYDESLAKRRAAIEKSDAENPVLNTALAIGGGLSFGGTAGAATPAGAGLPTVQIFTNPTAPRVLSRGGDAALTGLGYGALTGFTEGEGGFLNRAENAYNVGSTSAAIAGPVAGVGQAVANRLAATQPGSITQQANDIGVRIPSFMEGGRSSVGIAGKLGGMPFVGDDINDAVAVARSQTGQAARNISDNIAGSRTTPRGAGEAVRDAANTFADDGARAIQNRVYDAVDQQMSGRIAPLSATRRTAQTLADDSVRAASPLHARAVGEVEEALGRPNGLEFAGLSQLRTRIGTLIDNTIDTENRTARAGLQRIYGALTDDMETAINTQGGAQAQRLWQRANTVARQVAERRDTAAKVIGAEGDKAGENIVDRVVAMAGSGRGSPDAARLRQFRRTVGADAWRQLSASAVERLGRNSNNEFSPDFFLKGYRALSDEGRQLLFGSTGQQIVPHLENLAAVSARLQQFSRLGNPSGSGGVGALLTAMAGVGAGDGGAVAATMVAGRGVGYLMSRPAVVRQASRHAAAMERVMRTGAGRSALAASAAALARVIAKETGEDEAAVLERIEAVGQ